MREKIRHSTDLTNQIPDSSSTWQCLPAHSDNELACSRSTHDIGQVVWITLAEHAGGAQNDGVQAVFAVGGRHFLFSLCGGSGGEKP